MPPVRRLTAILAADVAGYSRLMGVDEEGTHERLKAHLRELIEPKIAEHRGRVVKNTGDGFLAEFVSVVDAMRCAVEMQRGMAERNAATPPEKRIEFRVGINLGDVIAEEHDIFGDGVNVAARLEALAEPGGICVSRVVRDQVRDRLPFTYEDLGEQSVKNITRPVRAYRVRDQAAPRQELLPGSPLALQLPDKPSLAVLPFQNLSGDPEEDYFSDGIVEEITSALSRFRSLFVIARNSAFTYKGRAVDVRQVGRELGVRYLLEGSVRKAANRVRINGQLIDAATATQLWADHFDGKPEDIFDLQDNMTASVVGAISPALEQAEIGRAKRKPTESLGAYDYFLRGRAALHEGTLQGHKDILRLFSKAIELDPEFASAYGMAAYCYCHRKTNGWMEDREREIAEAERLARRAVELDKDDGLALSYGGFSLAYVVGELEAGVAFIDRALLLNPNLATAWIVSAWVRIWLGHPDVAIEHLAKATRLSPLDPLTNRTRTTIALAHLHAGRYDEASSWAGMVVREWPDFQTALRIASASYALAGRLGEAKNTCERLQKLDPKLRLSNLVDELGPYTRPQDIVRYKEGLRSAGLPD
jgi:TolB-like protein/class 3 adenylate cyclase/Tfp pilus assembly protein PilF